MITIGEIYGRLEVLAFSHRDARSNPYYLCRCSCIDKTEKPILGGSLTSGDTKSCGCITRENGKASFTTHGLCSDADGNETKTYKAWSSMRERCLNPSNPRYDRYGGRGITICDEWFHSYEAFYKFFGDIPEGLSLGRIDNDGNYCPENCRLETLEQQANNKCNSHNLEFQGRIQTVTQWCRELGLSPPTVFQRLKNGWSVEEALMPSDVQTLEYQGKCQTIIQWCRELGLPPNTIYQRLHRGWSVERSLTTPV